MKIAATVARYALGLFFTVFGLNGFVHFIPLPPKPPMATQFVGLLEASHYMVPVFALQLVAGLIFLSGRYLPLALTLIGPVLVNILLFHILMDLPGIVPGLLATVCWLIVFWHERSAFERLFRDRLDSGK